MHIDSKEYYGSRHASLTLSELLTWAQVQCQSPSVYTSVSYSFPGQDDPLSCPASLLSESRQYSLSLAPALVPSIGHSIDSLVKSTVSRYGSFRLLDTMGVIQPSGATSELSTLRIVPSSKEDVFKDKTLSLIAKRKLMKLLQFVVGDYEESEEWRGSYYFYILQSDVRLRLSFHLCTDHAGRTALGFIQLHFALPLELASAIIYAIAGCSDQNGTLSKPTACSGSLLRRITQSSSHLHLLV